MFKKSHQVDFSQKDKYYVTNLAGEPIPISQLWEGQRTAIIFLRRFECPTCHSYIILFSHLQTLLESCHIRIVFITCHSDISEVQTFLQSYAFWLRTLKKTPTVAASSHLASSQQKIVGGQLNGKAYGSGSRGAIQERDMNVTTASAKNDHSTIRDINSRIQTTILPGEIYLNPSLDVYKFFGLDSHMNQVEQRILLFLSNLYLSLGVSYKPNSFFVRLLSRLGLIHSATGYFVFGDTKERLDGIGQGVIMKQSPGIVIVENDRVLYRYICKNVNQPIPSRNDTLFAQSMYCQKEDLKDIQKVLDKQLKQFLNIISDMKSSAQIPHSELRVMERLGSGLDSDVFKANWYGLHVAIKFFNRGHNGSSVGPKIIKTHAYNNDHTPNTLNVNEYENTVLLTTTTTTTIHPSFTNEAAFLMSLSHKNVIKFLGFGYHSPHHFIILEYCALGSLFEVLQSHDRIPEIQSARKKSMLLDIAQGMQFLHGCTPKIIHQDLKSVNLLVTNQWRVKISDFGIASLCVDQSDEKDAVQRDNGFGTVQWMAPELLQLRVYASTGSLLTEGQQEPLTAIRKSTKVDVFSFGVIMWEVATRQPPWKYLDRKIVEKKVLNNERLELNAEWDVKFNSLVDACWAQDPNKRPEFRFIVKFLSKVDIPH